VFDYILQLCDAARIKIKKTEIETHIGVSYKHVAKHFTGLRCSSNFVASPHILYK